MTLTEAIAALVLALAALISQAAIYIKLQNDNEKAKDHRNQIEAKLGEVKFLAENGKTIVKVIPLNVANLEQKEEK